VLVIVGLVAVLSHRYDYQFDWTASGRNTLAEPSRALLERLTDPVRIQAYARKDEVLRRGISDLVARYQRHKADIMLDFINPDEVPVQTRELGISEDGELVIEYRGKTEHLKQHSEQALTNALHRVARAGERWVAYLSGHGERSLEGQANHDLGDWGAQLARRGYRLQRLDLAEAGAVPANTSVLLVAAPRVDLLPGEVSLIRSFIEEGGNLLWLLDPGPTRGLEPLADVLGLELQPGVLVDPNARRFGIEQPGVVLVTRYGSHPITDGFELLTLYPWTLGLATEPVGDWEVESMLSTSERVWAETAALSGKVQFDQGADLQGPFDVGVVLRREKPTTANAAEDAGGSSQNPIEQRVVIVGDGDFLSNAYLGNGGNLNLGMNIIDWLGSDDALIAIPPTTATDLSLTLSKLASAIIGLTVLLGLPLILFASGITIWLKRRHY
jgi:ABC-type uncharacterized transport system involved in gliding motility auxiliary subunit